MNEKMMEVFIKILFVILLTYVGCFISFCMFLIIPFLGWYMDAAIVMFAMSFHHCWIPVVLTYIAIWVFANLCRTIAGSCKRI